MGLPFLNSRAKRRDQIVAIDLGARVTKAVHLQRRNEKFTLVDVREESEFAKDHLPGAIHLGKGVIERDVEARIPDLNTPIVLYCGGGFRSALAADNLQKMGYTNVESMDGGWKGWLEAGLPTAKD